MNICTFHCSVTAAYDNDKTTSHITPSSLQTVTIAQAQMRNVLKRVMGKLNALRREVGNLLKEEK